MRRLGLSALMLSMCLALPALAQRSPPQPISGFQADVPQVPSKAGPADERFRAAASFVDSLSETDAMFEVVLGQGRLLTTEQDIATEGGTALIAVGDPSVMEFDVIGPRHIRMLGLRAGVTDLSIITSAGRAYNYEVHVVYDLNLLSAQLRQMFPEAELRLRQMREHIVVEGQARNTMQVANILQTIGGYLESVQGQRAGGAAQPSAGPPGPRAAPSRQAGGTGGTGAQEQGSQEGAGEEGAGPVRGEAAAERGPRPAAAGRAAQPQIINLIHVPGPQQVLLKVQVAELNRTALRQIGADLFIADGNTILGSVIGSQLGEIAAEEGASIAETALSVTAGIPGSTTAFGIFDSGDFRVLLTALRENSILKILAEPNLVTMHGQQADFLAGGEFPIVVPQSFGGGAAGGTFTVDFKRFGVQLAFVPYILDDDRLRLEVTPEVSSVDFSLAATLVPGASPTPGINTRRAHTVVELRQGQTLAIAGLLQVELSGNTARIPGLGDLPYIGPLFSNTSSRRVEKELLVLVTPYLVEPMDAEEVPPLPGNEVYEPNDLEFYLLNRIEGRTGRDFRSTTKWDDPFDLVRRLKLEKRYIQGDHGFSE